MIKENKYRTAKKYIGIFLMALPFIGTGVYGIITDQFREFGIAILIALAILLIVSAGAYLFVENE
jgi:hypothetical protein